MTGTADQPEHSAPMARFTAEQRGVLLGAGVVVLTMVVLAIVAVTIGRDRSTTNLGDDRFEDIKAERILEAVESGGPVFFPDLAEGGRDIYVTHTGDDPLEGYLAFSARNTQTGCLVEWKPDIAGFADTCDETAVFEAVGTGLEQYPVELREGRLVIDINYAEREVTTTTTAG